MKIDDWSIENKCDKKTLAEIFARFLPQTAILTDEEDLHPYECDGLSAYRQLPLMVLLPENIEQLQQILKTCHKNDIAVVCRGAGTSLSGGALPLSQGIVVSLAKFNQILSVDIEKRTAWVQPGVRNLAISEAVAAHGLFYAPDPSSQIACSIGGNVAENAGGVHCLKYGLTVHNVRQLKVLTIRGELLTLGNQTLDQQGYDLLALLHGSEGMLAVVVAVAVNLLPKPECIQVVMASFDRITDAGHCVSDIIASGIIPAGLELMDRAAIQAAEDFIHAGYPTDVEAILLCEIDGSAIAVQQQLQQLQKLLQKGGAVAVEVASDAAQRQKFWAGRKAAFPAVGRISPDYYCMDGTIPRYQLANILDRIQQLSEKYQLPVVNVFHAGDGNLHPLILYDANIPGQLEQTEAMGGEILAACVELGGTITGEHGVGVEKLDQMCVQFSSDELQQFLDLKKAFDEKGLLNPGKAIPLLHRCAELGALHVHHGQLPHADLERF